MKFDEWVRFFTECECTQTEKIEDNGYMWTLCERCGGIIDVECIQRDR